MFTDEPSTNAAASEPAVKLAVCVLASGSKGNAIHVSDGQTAFLIDAGLSGVEIERRLGSRGLAPDRLQAIIVSHEHADHINGVGVLSRRYRLPVYLNRKTAGAAKRIGRLHCVNTFDCGTVFHIDNLHIHPFSLSHDAEDPAGFTVKTNGIKIGLATDLGVVTAMVTEHLKGCRALILEANHDTRMLIDGPYPWPLKQRIQSRLGHLSNTDSRQLLCDVAHADLEHVILAHLSETNNTPDTALNAIAPALTGTRTRLEVAVQDRCTEIVCL
ncbi:MAG: MBL fold metallo-hydrolase, partial [Desulfobacterales bacterium]